MFSTELHVERLLRGGKLSSVSNDLKGLWLRPGAVAQTRANITVKSSV